MGSSLLRLEDQCMLISTKAMCNHNVSPKLYHDLVYLRAITLYLVSALHQDGILAYPQGGCHRSLEKCRYPDMHEYFKNIKCNFLKDYKN